MTPRVENRYVERIDRRRLANELGVQGFPAEEFVNIFYNTIPGFQARFSTLDEDKGPEVGGRQTVDLVVSFADGRPAFASQITTNNAEKGLIDKKKKEMRDRPFIRLNEMKNTDLSIPKVLVVPGARQVKDFFQDPDPAKHPELALKVIEDHLNSFRFDRMQTQNPLEQKAVDELIKIFDTEKKRYIH